MTTHGTGPQRVAGDTSAVAAEVHHLVWPLTGRADELDRLVRAVVTSSAALVGPAGVGKTRLLEELRAEMNRVGRPVLRMTATHTSSAIPLGTVAPLLDDEAINVQQTLAGARRIAERLSGHVVLIDDAHLLDDASATLVHHLTMLGTTIVSTVRSGSDSPDAVVSPTRDGHAVRIDLQPLTPENVRSLLHSVLGADVDDATLHQLYRLSGGNLVYLYELIRGALDTGALTRERAVWRLHSPPGANPGLTQLLRTRLLTLTEHERELLELMAIAEPMSLAAAEHAVGHESLARLESMDLIAVDRNARRHEIRMTHPLYSEILRGGLSTIRQVALHRIAAEQLEATPMRRRDDPIRAAVHRLEGGGAVDASVVASAAEHAVVTGDLELGAKLAHIAIMSGDRVRGGLLLAETLSQAGRDLDAIAPLEEAWTSATDEDDIALIGITKAVVTLRTTGDINQGLAVLDAATARISEVQCLAELDAQRAVFSLLRGDLDAAVRHGLQVVNNATGRPLLSAAVGCVPAMAVQGRGEEALDVAHRALATELETAPCLAMPPKGIHVVGQALALQEMGRLDEARIHARRGYDDTVDARAAEGQGWMALMLGRIEVAAGRLGTAGRWFDEGVAVFSDMGYFIQERWCHAGRVQVDALLGDPAVATSAERLRASDIGLVSMMDVDTLRAFAWAAVVLEDIPTALKRLDEAVCLARDQGAAALESTCLHDMVRLGGPSPVERLSELADVVDGELANVRAQHAVAAKVSNAVSLLEVSDAFEAMGFVLYAAEAAAQASAVLVASGERRRARMVSQRASALVRLTEGAVTPLLELRGASAELTRREREVAGLAAKGVTNAAIALRLGVSTRTVENHLQRTYEKLGVHGREDLAAALRADGSA